MSDTTQSIEGFVPPKITSVILSYVDERRTPTHWPAPASHAYVVPLTRPASANTELTFRHRTLSVEH